MPALLLELFDILVPIIRNATPEIQGIFVAWLHKYRITLENAMPEGIQEIEHAITSHDDERVSQLVHRLRNGTHREPPGV